MSLRNGLALAVLVLLCELTPMELSLVYPTLPHMSRDFPTPSLGWVITVMSLAAVVLMPLVGKLADMYGKLRIIVALTALCAIGSLICALASSFPMLLAGRAVQAAAAGITPVALALIRDIFPRRFVPLALGVIMAGTGLSAVLSPFIAGALVDGHGWQAVFWFMLIYSVVLIPIALLVVPESALRLHQRLNVPGVLLLGGGVGLILVAISQGSAWGWTDGRIVAAFAGGAALLIAFTAWELKADSPAVSIRMLTSPAVRSTMLLTLCISFAMSGYGLLLPQLLQTPSLPALGVTYGFGLTVTATALWTLPNGILTMFAGPLGGALARWRGARYSAIGAGVTLTAALLGAAALPDYRWQILIIAGLCGIGIGLQGAATSNLLMDAVPAHESGVGASVMRLSGQLGIAISVAVLGSVMSPNIIQGPNGRILYTDAAFQHAFWVSAAVAVIGLAIALFMRHGRSPAAGGGADRTVPDQSEHHTTDGGHPANRDCPATAAPVPPA